jgi:hypothetical protein
MTKLCRRCNQPPAGDGVLEVRDGRHPALSRRYHVDKCFKALVRLALEHGPVCIRSLINMRDPGFDNRVLLKYHPLPRLSRWRRTDVFVWLAVSSIVANLILLWLASR